MLRIATNKIFLRVSVEQQFFISGIDEYKREMVFTKITNTGN